MNLVTITKPLLAVIFVVASAAPLAAPLAEDSVLMRAMRDELARSMAELRLEDAEKPYFLAYRVQERTYAGATASLGGLLSASEGVSRQLFVELRVGDYGFDNTNFRSMANAAAMMPNIAALSVDDDYDTLRRQIWLATDTAYKRALDQLAGKRAALQNQTQVKDVPDFSEMPPHRYDGGTDGQLDTAPARTLARDVSAAMRGKAHLSRSEVRVTAHLERTWFFNSEGSEFVRESPYIELHGLAAAQAIGGTELEDFVALWVRRWEDLPAPMVLAEHVRAMTKRLEQRREADHMQRYAGPVLFEGQAAAELVSQVFGPRLVAVRMPTFDNPAMQQASARFRNPFVDKIGSRVLPRFLSMVSDPTIEGHDGVPLWGRQPVDDDGLPAQRTLLVERGILKTLLSTRVPLAEVPNSTASRWRDMTVPGSFFVTPSRGLSDEELKQELFALAAERGLDHAIIVRRIGSRLAKLNWRSSGYVRDGRSSGVEPLIGAYKAFPDGREELIPIAVLSTLSESDFRNIVNVSEATSRHDTGFSPAAAGGLTGFGTWPVSVITPALLFEDVNVRRPRANIPTPPLTPHPLSKG